MLMKMPMMMKNETEPRKAVFYSMIRDCNPLWEQRSVEMISPGGRAESDRWDNLVEVK